jgi:hypothetical protein
MIERSTMFNQLNITRGDIDEEASRIDAALNDKSHLTEPAAFASKVIAKRLREHPTAYLEFGPYWWAVKATMRAQGEDFGAADDEQIRMAYGGDLPALSCLAAGELFKEYYRTQWLAGNAQFWLDDGAEESYVLFDADMEARRLGPGALAVGANLTAQPEPDEPENPPPAAA